MNAEHSHSDFERTFEDESTLDSTISAAFTALAEYEALCNSRAAAARVAEGSSRGGGEAGRLVSCIGFDRLEDVRESRPSN